MNCQSAREIFPALLDSRTAATAHSEARAHLENCPGCQQEFAGLQQTLAALDGARVPPPSPRLRRNFHALLEEEKLSAASVPTAAGPARRVVRWRWIPAALLGGALLLLGFAAGSRVRPPAITPDADAEAATQRELRQLREQVATMGQLVGYALLQQQQGPVNDRLRGVLASAQTDRPDDKVLDDLISALVFDPSANVRLRALEALYPHAGTNLVRAGVLGALPREQNPLVQLELIDFVAASRNRDATPLLEKMSRNESVDRTVRDAAKRALTQL